MVLRIVFLAGLLLGAASPTAVDAAQAPRMILTLGSSGFLDPGGVQSRTGATVKAEMEKFRLKDFALIVLANAPLGGLPAAVQSGLVQYVNEGGAVLITGGSQSFGSGGYQAVASVLPFELRSSDDWRFTPFRSPVILQPGHPILTGVSFIPVGTLNDMNPRRDAAEIMQAAGGGSAARRATGTGGGSYPYPLIAELGVGAGRVLGVAFDLNEYASMRDRDLFVRNTIGYLLAISRAGLGQ